MVPFCTDCDIDGDEKQAPGTQGSFTLESCKQACIDDSDCYGIDFGHYGNSVGKCYMTTSALSDNGWNYSHKFDGYKKVKCALAGISKFVTLRKSDYSQ